MASAFSATLPVPDAGLEPKRLHVREVDVACEVFGAPERPLFGDDVASVSALAARLNVCREIGARAVHLVDHEDVRHLRRFEMVDDCVRLDDATGIGFNDDDGGVDPRECLFRLFEEVDETGSVDDRDVEVVGGRVGEAHGRRLQVGSVLGLVIGYRGPVGDRAAPSDRSGVGEDRFDESRLPGVMWSDESDIP